MEGLLRVRERTLKNRRVPVLIVDDPHVAAVMTSSGSFTDAGAHLMHLLLELQSRSLASVFLMTSQSQVLWPILEQRSVHVWEGCFRTPFFLNFFSFCSQRIFAPTGAARFQVHAGLGDRHSASGAFSSGCCCGISCHSDIWIPHWRSREVLGSSSLEES